MSINKFLTIDEQIEKLKNNNKLIFPNEKSIEIFKIYLNDYGYYNVVKNNCHPKMFEENINNKIYFENFSSNNLRYLFDINRIISGIFYKYFRGLELKLNSSTITSIAKKLDKLEQCPYIASLGQKNFEIIFENAINNLSYFKKRKESVSRNIFNILFNSLQFNDNLIKTECNKVKNSESNHILKKIKNGWFYKENSKVEKSFSNWEYVNIFALSNTLLFSQLKRIFNLLSNEIQNEIIWKFLNKKKITIKCFEIIITILVDIRNNLSHNGNLLNYNIKLNELSDDRDANEEFTKLFGLKSENINLVELIKISEYVLNVNKENDQKIKIKKEIEEAIVKKISYSKANINKKYNDEISTILIDILNEIFDLNIKLNNL